MFKHSWKKITSAITFAGLLSFGGSAQAGVVFGDNGVALETVFNSITIAPIPGDSSIDVNADQLVKDQYWSIGAVGVSAQQIVVELAGNADGNNFGVYDATNPNTSVLIFGGRQNAGAIAVLSIGSDGSVFVDSADTGVDFAGSLFGYFLDSTSFFGGDDFSGGFWYSDRSLNSDGVDHMAAYQGQNVDTIDLPASAPGLWTDDVFALAFEDLDCSTNGGCDAEYTDFVVMVESVFPVPVPGTATLLGIGLVGLSLPRRSRKA